MSAGQGRARKRNLAGGMLGCCLATMALLVASAASSSAAHGAPVAGILGKNTVGASSDYFAAERKRVNRYALPAAGSLTKLSVYLAPHGSGQQLLKGVVYADTGNGAPGALLGASEALTFTGTSAAGWYDLPLPSPLKLAAGNYWIGVITGPSAGVAGFRYDTVAGSRDYNANTFSSGPSNPFGPVSTDSEQMSLYGTYTTQPPPAPPGNTAPPTISGAPEQGKTLTEEHGSWTNEPTSFTYQWLQCDSFGNGCLPISGATGQTYVPAKSDVGQTLVVQETAYNEAGPSSPASSTATTAVTGQPPPANTAVPMIIGTAQAGQTLTAENGSWTNEPTSFTYQWQRCDAAGSNCSQVTGGMGQARTYLVGPADVGFTMRLAVTASNAGGPSAPATSAPTGLVQPAQATASLGKTTVGASSDYFAAERKRVNRYALPAAGSLTKLSVYLAPHGSGQQLLKGVVYADTGNGAPGALLGASEALTFTGTSAAGWYDLPLPSPLKLAAGNYWIGVITGPSAGVAGFRYDTVAGSRDYNANTFSSGPSNPFGPVSTDSEQMSLYGTYTTGVDTSPPSQPQGLHASAASSTQISLSWEPSSDDVGVVGYDILREGVVVGSAGATATSYTDSGLTPATAYTYTVDAYDAAGNHSPQSAPASATTLSSSAVQHYEYVFPANAIDVYDMDNGQKLIKTIALPQAATDIRGAVASPATHMLYVSYGGDGGPRGGGSMLAYDLVGERIVWTHTYPEGVDSMAIGPDGKTIYLPVGEESSSSTWDVVEASSGNIVATIQGGKGPHNTIVSLSGQHVYMGGRTSSYLTVANTSNDEIVKQIGPLLNGGVRPFTINGHETLAFTTATSFLGFQVSSITGGQVLYTVPVSGPFPYTPGQPGPSSPSHGISISPDERELWVIDQPNSYVHVFDITGLPTSAPRQIADIKLTRPMTGTQAGCTYDCLREGWLQHSLDGRFVYVGDSGDVIDTGTRLSVANLEPLYNSRVFLEIDWSNGVPVATSSRSGVGYVR